ncbi:hypothetical protein FKM82_023167 [Ascaphus truei]
MRVMHKDSLWAPLMDGFPAFTTLCSNTGILLLCGLPEKMTLVRMRQWVSMTTEDALLVRQTNPYSGTLTRCAIQLLW